MPSFKKKQIAALHRYVQEGRTEYMGTPWPVKQYWEFARVKILDIGCLADVDEWDDLSCEEEFSLPDPHQSDWPINLYYVAENVLKMFAAEQVVPVQRFRSFLGNEGSFVVPPEIQIIFVHAKDFKVVLEVLRVNPSFQKESEVRQIAHTHNADGTCGGLYPDEISTFIFGRMDLSDPLTPEEDIRRSKGFSVRKCIHTL